MDLAIVLNSMLLSTRVGQELDVNLHLHANTNVLDKNFGITTVVVIMSFIVSQQTK